MALVHADGRPTCSTQRFGVGFELVAFRQLQAFESGRLGEPVDEDRQVVDEPLVLQLVHGEVGLDRPGFVRDGRARPPAPAAVVDGASSPGCARRHSARGLRRSPNRGASSLPLIDWTRSDRPRLSLLSCAADLGRRRCCDRSGCGGVRCSTSRCRSTDGPGCSTRSARRAPGDGRRSHRPCRTRSCRADDRPCPRPAGPHRRGP